MEHFLKFCKIFRNFSKNLYLVLEFRTILWNFGKVCMSHGCFVKIFDACSWNFPNFIKNFACAHRRNKENFHVFFRLRWLFISVAYLLRYLWLLFLHVFFNTPASKSFLMNSSILYWDNLFWYHTYNQFLDFYKNWHTLTKLSTWIPFSERIINAMITACSAC